MTRVELTHRLSVLRIGVGKIDQPQVYLSGPMTAIPWFNFHAFEVCAEVLRDAGWFVYSPRENDAEKNVEPNPDGKLTGDHPAYKELMKLDLWQVCDSDAVIVMPGWEWSEGALLEVEVAHRVGVPVYTYLHQREVEAPERAPHEFSSRRMTAREALLESAAGLGDELEVATTASLTSMRQFESGATRNRDDDNIDYEGFLSPLAIQRYGEYMHSHRRQADGSIRDSDNWQKGIPADSYVKSLWRHAMDVWLIHRGRADKAREDEESALCAIIFNAQGKLHELLKPKPVERAA